MFGCTSWEGAKGRNKDLLFEISRKETRSPGNPSLPNRNIEHISHLSYNLQTVCGLLGNQQLCFHVSYSHVQMTMPRLPTTERKKKLSTTGFKDFKF